MLLLSFSDMLGGFMSRTETADLFMFSFVQRLFAAWNLIWRVGISRYRQWLPFFPAYCWRIALQLRHPSHSLLQSAILKRSRSQDCD
jgi:hypothetical protein